MLDGETIRPEYREHIPQILIEDMNKMLPTSFMEILTRLDLLDRCTIAPSVFRAVINQTFSHDVILEYSSFLSQPHCIASFLEAQPNLKDLEVAFSFVENPTSELISYSITQLCSEIFTTATSTWSAVFEKIRTLTNFDRRRVDPSIIQAILALYTAKEPDLVYSLERMAKILTLRTNLQPYPVLPEPTSPTQKLLHAYIVLAYDHTIDKTLLTETLLVPPTTAVQYSLLDQIWKTKINKHESLPQLLEAGFVSKTFYGNMSLGKYEPIENYEFSQNGLAHDHSKDTSSRQLMQHNLDFRTVTFRYQDSRFHRFVLAGATQRTLG